MGACNSHVISGADYADRYRIVPTTDERTFDRAWREFIGTSFRIDFGYRVRHENGAIILSTDREMPKGPASILRRVADIYPL